MMRTCRRHNSCDPGHRSSLPSQNPRCKRIVVSVVSGHNGAQALAAQVRKVIAALDEKGRWVADGRIYCQDFVRNFNVLAEYVERMRDPAAPK